MPHDVDEEWVMYCDRPEWKDVTPAPQDDGPYSVVAIAYSPRFKDVYDYFRAVVKTNELSERALDLTKDALDLNPSNYSVWQFRRDIIKHLGKNLKEELQLTEKIIRKSEKNYQVWHHRRVIVEWADDPSDEDRVTSYFLTQDQKNYHAWQHRQWYLQKYSMFEGELDFVDSLIKADVRNNSAWNQRYFVIRSTGLWTDEVVLREVTYTLEQMKKTAKNESAWNYLKGVLTQTTNQAAHDVVLKFCEQLYTSGERNPFLLAYIVDMCLEAVETRSGVPGLSGDKALQLCDELANSVDTIRSGYWRYFKEKIAQAMAINGEALL